EGGMAKAVAAGWPKAMIEEAAAARQARVDRAEDVVVGVNKYRLPSEDHLETLDVDNAKVREGQIARINAVKASRDEAACKAALDALRRGCKNENSPPQGEGDQSQTGGGVMPAAAGDTPPSGADAPATSPAGGGLGFENNLLALAVDAARARATLGEISLAMEDVFGRYATTPTPVKGVYAAPYADDSRWAQVVDGVKAVERRLGRKPKLLVAKMGQDGHDRGANVIASAFGDLGFDIVSGPLFQTPDETVVLALESNVDVVGASSLAAGHKTLIPSLLAGLKEAGRNDIKVIVGGVIPPQDYDFLRDVGVQGIYGPGSNVVECAADVLRLLGHNMPPLEEPAE
uniref:methylmalonyl-CoA mutase family protein n=1 Tax=Blastomonas sp. TaxID=1909299 RepID=UPI003593428B